MIFRIVYVLCGALFAFALTKTTDISFDAPWKTALILCGSGAASGLLLHEILRRFGDGVRLAGLGSSVFIFLIYYMAFRKPDYKPESNQQLSEAELRSIFAGFETADEDSDDDFFTDEDRETDANQIIQELIEISKPVDTNIRLSDEELRRHELCQVCGFKAVDPNHPEKCQHCFTETFAYRPSRTVKYSKWIRKKQLHYFSVYAADEEIVFFRPPSSRGFTPDPEWKPIVSEEEVRQYSKENTYNSKR